MKVFILLMIALAVHAESPSAPEKSGQPQQSLNDAKAAMAAGNLELAKATLQKVIRLDKRNAEAFQLLGDVAKKQGDQQADGKVKRHDYRYALASYEMVAKLEPQKVDGYLGMADLYCFLNDLAPAKMNYRKVLDISPGNPQAQSKLDLIQRGGSCNGTSFPSSG